MTIATEAATPRRRWRLWLAWLVGLVALMVVWWTQPHLGASVCPMKGFMWETDFVEEVRPRIRSIVGRRRLELDRELPAGLTVAQFVAVADEAINLLKQCVAERGVKYCRYVGPDPNGIMMHARTNEGPNAIEQKDEPKYRYIKTGLDYEMSVVPTDATGTWVRFQTSRFGRSLPSEAHVCDLGCWCNVNYGR